MVLNTDWAQVEVIDLINDGSGLAFGIIGGRSTGVVVKTIVPGGVADRDGRLQSGDHILQIGEVNLRGLGSEQVASVLRQCGVHVRMVVARPVESTSADYQNHNISSPSLRDPRPTTSSSKPIPSLTSKPPRKRALGSHAPIVPTKILGDPVELDKHLNDNGYGDIYSQNPSNSYSTPYIYTGQQTDVQLHTISGLVDVVRNPLPIGALPSLPPQALPPVADVNLLPLDMALREPSLPETETYTIDLMKDELGLGITVAGYVCEKEEISGIFVKSISKGSAADISGKIKINDRIIEVNGESVLGQNNHQAVEVLRKAGANVAIKFERYLRGPKYEQLQQAILANELRPTSPPSPSVSSLPKIPLSLVHMSSLGIEPEGESRTSMDFDSAVLHDLDTPTNDINEIVIETADGRRSVQFSICSHESIYEKWREKFKDDVAIVIAEMTKEAASGLGISLEGTVDVEDGQEVRPHHYIRNILPNGPVGKNAILLSGDELLEVNGIQLLGLNHLEVVSILKQLPSLVILVCARYSVPTRIIDTAQHRDAFQARNILAESISSLIQSSEKLVKAKSDSSLSSSIVSETCCSVGSRSKSLEIVAGLPMWSNEPSVVILNKGDHGLGFSILDYQDPLNPQETVIVIRSLVPGGVAQQDGRLIPGDRLLAVNDINVEHASLDRAVQILKGAPKGPVKISVAKPLSTNDSISHHSQDTEDDQTCIDDFQECIEEYQECLEVVQICIEDDRSFNHSPCVSQVEDFGVRKNQKVPDEPDVSFKSVCDTNVAKLENGLAHHLRENLTKNDSLQSDKGGSQRAEDSEKDGYETCLDESFSEEVAKLEEKTPTNSTYNLSNESKVKYKSELYVNLESTEIQEDIELNKQLLEKEIAEINQELQKINKKKESLRRKYKKRLDAGDSILVEHVLVHEPIIKQADILQDDGIVPLTEKNLKSLANFGEMRCIDDKSEDDERTIGEVDFTVPVTPTEMQKSFATSEPCLNIDFQKHNHNHLDRVADDGLKSYENAMREDEFFLVQYPDDLTEKCHSEPNVLDRLNKPTTYRYRIAEYYNDIEDCLQSFREAQNIQHLHAPTQPELSDDEIFNEIPLPIRSRSAPDILDNSFITLTYDPGPDTTRRKSFVPGYNIQSDNVPMVMHTNSNTMKNIDVSNMLEKHWGPTRVIKIYRDPNTSLGISIVGGKVDLYHESSSETILGIFIKNVVENSPAGRCKELKTGDRILEVSGVSLKNVSHENAVEAIKFAKNPVTLVVQSLMPYSNSQEGPYTNELNCLSPHPSPIKSSTPAETDTPQIQSEKSRSPPPVTPQVSQETVLKETPTPIQNSTVHQEPKLANLQEPKIADIQEPKLPEYLKNAEDTNKEKVAPRQKTVESSEESDDEEDVRDLTGRTVTSKGQEIDRGSAGNIKRTQEEITADPEEEDDFGYTMNKVKKKYLSLGHSILMVQLERSAGQGLGLSLAGHKDRNCMAVFVCGINPNGAAFRTGGIQVGDEILEVNGVVLHGRCHLNASAIIKGLSGPIFKLIILRRKAAIDDIAVRPITQFPVSLAEEASEESFSNYPNVRTVAIKKGSQSLGIMIIEGKHAEVGQGIFISDIQEGSSAEKAGLEIGEMILAVNKDSLLGSNYDTAANLLKRTEGLVTLVVSNPGKRTTTPVPEGGDKASALTAKGLKAAPAASRPTTPTPEPPADPATCQIIPGKDTTLEIASDNKGLGVCFVGGKDTPITGGVIIVEVYPGGAADKDGRLQPGDQILDVNGTSLKDVTYNAASQSLRQTLPKMKMIVYRSEKPDYQTIDTEFVKKPGKGLGLSIVVRKSGKGVYVSDILNGGCADVDGKITKGDLLVSVNGQNIDASTSEEASAVLKTVTGKVSLKLHRYKPVAR